MCLAAMKLGYTRRDLFEVTYSELAWDFEAMRERDADNKAESDGAVKEATQDDIRRMLG